MTNSTTNNEDTGASSGWSIANSRQDATSPSGPWSSATAELRIAIRGTQEIPSTDAKLSGLALENAADDSAITLSPAFMSGTTAYTASVANAVGEVTIKPTKSHDGAEVAYLDGSGAEIADADGVKAGHQAALAVGANTIRVKVTAQDTVATETYTLTLTRGPPLWTTRMTVGLAGDGARGFSRVGSNTLGSLTDETFEYPTASTKRITEITASSAGGVQLRVRSGSSDIAGLVLEWAGETLPLADAGKSGHLFTWSQTWLNANAPSLKAADFAATLPEGGRGLVCLRAATEACPSTDIATNSTATGAPAISGAAQAGQTLTASLGTVTDADGVPSALTWQWVRVASGGTETVVGANSSFYTPAAADVGATVKVKVSFTDRAGYAEGPLESAETAAVLAAPGACPANSDWCATLTVEESIIGHGSSYFGFARTDSLTFGQLSDTTIEFGGATYTVSVATFNDFPSMSNDSFSVALDAFLPRGAVLSLDGTEFTADADSELTATGDYQWAVPADFAWADGQKVTVSVRFPNRAATGAPTISGTAAVGQTLTAGPGDTADEDGLPTVFPEDYSFQWVRRSGSTETDIPGATGRTYTLASADQGKTVKVKLSFTDRRGHRETRTSDAHPELGSVAASGSVPSVALVKNLNQSTLSGFSPANAKWAQQFTTGSHARGYLLGRVKINIYQFGGSDTFTLQVCETNSSGHPTSTCTSLTPPGNFGNIGTGPTLTFTAPANTVLDPGTKYAVVVDSTGTANSAVRFQRTTSNNEDSGKQAGWSIANTFHLRSGGTWGASGSGHSLRIAIEGGFAPNQVATGGPAITGTAAVGQTLTASIGTTADENGLPATFPDDYSFQWLRVAGGSTTPIPGATARTYTLSPADAGAKLRVRASFTDDGGSAEIATGEAWPSTGTVVTMSTPSQGLVGNTGQTSGTATALGSAEYAQMFRTGRHAAGYALDAIKLAFDTVPPSGNASRVRAELRKGLHAGATVPTNATVAVLSNPSNLTSGTGLKTFTAPGGTRLEPNTNYFLFVSYNLGPGLDERALSQTNSGAEDAGRADGWSIANERLSRDQGSSGSWAARASRVLKISVEGSVLSNPAIGKPTISGVPQEGMTLTASPDGIVDPDGLPASFTWQWVRIAPGGAETDIGSSAATYTLVAADAGATIVARTSFTDNAGNAEGPLESDPAGPVAAAARACPADNIWCRTVTVEDAGAGVVQLVTGSESTADRRFTHDGTTYTVTGVQVRPVFGGSSLDLYLDRFLPRGTVLHVGGHELLTGNGSELLTGEFEYSWDWPGDAALHDGQRVRLALRAQENHAATGKPEISGRAEVGRTLVASVGGIADGNGLANASYSYQWVRVDADGTSSPTVVQTSNIPTYTLAAADQGKRIRVYVSLTDDAGFEEGPFESDPFPAGTDTVAAAPAATVGALVSNTGQGNLSSVGTNSGLSQQFTTGAATGGYPVTGVDIVVTGSNSFTLSVCETNSSGAPTSTCTAFTAPMTFAAGTLGFTAPSNTVLEANTTYTVVALVGGSSAGFSLARADAEDAGKAAGWSIANAYSARNSGTLHHSGYSLRIAIRGTLANTAATGAPAITGPPQAGGTLTADTSGISDADGLTGVTYDYRWIRVAPDDTETVVAIDSPTYTPKAGDVGHSFKLAVEFDDDNGYYETLESEAVGPVVAAAPACPAEYIWCRTVTAADDGLGTLRLVTGSESLDDRRFEHDGTTYTVSRAAVSVTGVDRNLTVDFRLDRSLPRGTALHIGGHELVADAASETSNTGQYQWQLPEDAVLHDGQRVRLLLALAGNNAALSALALEDAASGAGVPLSQAFRQETTFYRAEVDKHVTAVTLTAETASSRAAMEVLDFDLNELQDADGVKDGFQLALKGGDNRFRIRVTAEDGMTVRTYKLRVDRETWLWTATAETGLAGDGTRGFSRFMGNSFGTLDRESFSYPQSARKVTVLTAGPVGVRLRTDGPPSDLAGLVLQWAGETLPLDEAARAGLYLTWDQPWLDANAPSLNAANYAATLPEGRRGKLCLRSAGISCPSTRLAANSPATGKPTVSGAPQVGETLTAATNAIRDANGLPRDRYGLLDVAYSYQWVRIDRNAQILIPGATSKTYTVQPADLGKVLKVKVTFTDDLGYPEGALVSEPYPPSGAILPARAACPPDAAWCSAITVGTRELAGRNHTGWLTNGPGKATAGAIDDETADIGNREIGITRLSLVAAPGTDAVDLRTADVELPRGTVLTLDGSAFTLDDGSRQGGNTDRWTRPPGLSWTAGQRVTVSLRLPAWTRNKRLAALSLENAADDAPITIDPAFDPATGTYTAVVPSGVDKVTVEGTAEEDTATVGYFGTRSSTLERLTDADGVKEGHQVALWTGNADNTLFNVRVTAWDRTSRNYRMVVKRTASATVPDLVLTYPGRMDGGGALAAIMATSSNAAGHHGGEMRQPFSGVETRSRCVGRKYTLRGPDGLPKTNVAWSLEPWVRSDGVTVTGHDRFTIGSDGQIRTVVGVDYPFRGRFGYMRFTVRATDLDSGNSLTSGFEVVLLHPQGYATDASKGNYCANPGLTVADAEAAEGPGATLDFTVSLRPAAKEAVTVAYATSDGTATANDDYTPIGGTLTFRPGETRKTVSVPVLDDSVEDSGETVIFTLSGVSGGGAVLGDDEATGTIYNDEDEMAAADALTASFPDLPSEHDGAAAFSFTLTFSEEVEGLDAATLKDSVLELTGGTVTKAEPVTEGSGASWTVEVEPDGDGAVEIALPATTDCAAAGALCTSGGTMLSEAVSATVPGPATETPLTAAFSELPEAHDGSGAFTFELTFSEDVGGLSFRTLKFGGIEVTGGTVTRALRHPPGTNRHWTIHVEPDGDGPVTVVLPQTTDCEAAGAVCDPDGRMLSNESRATVPGPAAAADGPQPLTAAFSDLPDEHDGETAFAFELTFSEDVGGLSFRTLKFGGIEASGGTVTRALRHGPGTNRHWTIHVEPDGNGPVTVVLPETTDCEADGAVCAPDGRKLSNESRATVQGPPGLSVADAEANEADTNAALAFVVTLDRAASGAVTVDYETSDGTAVAPGDYAETSGTLTFAAGETAKTVSVPVVSDAEDEGDETMTLTLSGPTGAYLADATATGTIKNTGPIPKAWIARFGRTVADQLLAAVEERLGAARAPGAEIGLGGQRIGLGPLFGRESGEGAAAGGKAAGAADEGAASRAGLAAAADAEEKAKLEALTAWLNGEDPEKDAQAERTRSMTGREVLMGSSFNFAAGTDGGGFAALWGRIARARFAGREGTLSVDGDVTTGLLGFDRAWDRWTTGLVVSRSTGTGGYSGASSGDIDATVTAVTPWAGYAASDKLSLWAAAGYGAGELTVKPDEQAAMKTDLSMTLAAAGLRAALLDGDGPRLDAVTGARWVRTTSARLSSSSGNLAAAQADVWRLTLGLEGAWPIELGEEGKGATATPRLALGLRHDGGDAETGYGVDIAGGIDLALPARGLTASVSGRGVLSHEADGLSDRGIAGALAWTPRASGRGPSLSLTQTFGAGASSGKDALLGRETLEGLAANDNGDELEQRRLEARFGYGFAMFGDRFTGTPEIALGLSQTGRDYSLGWRIVNAGAGTGSLELTLEATRRETANQDTPPEHGVGLRLTARW